MNLHESWFYLWLGILDPVAYYNSPEWLGSIIPIYWILVGEYTDYFMAYNDPYITWYLIPYITQQGFDQSSCRMETESSMD